MQPLPSRSRRTQTPRRACIPTRSAGTTPFSDSIFKESGRQRTTPSPPRYTSKPFWQSRAGLRVEKPSYCKGGGAPILLTPAFQDLLLMTRWGHRFCRRPRFKYLLLVKRWRIIDKACYDAFLTKVVEMYATLIRTSRSASREPVAPAVFSNGKQKHDVGWMSAVPRLRRRSRLLATAIPRCSTCVECLADLVMPCE